MSRHAQAIRRDEWRLHRAALPQMDRPIEPVDLRWLLVAPGGPKEFRAEWAVAALCVLAFLAAIVFGK